MKPEGYRLTDLERRLHNLLRVGTVSAVDAESARCRVAAGGITTTWLPWLTQRAGPDRTWWAPEPGEQVMLLSPSGDAAQAVVLPAVYRAAHPAPGERVTHHVSEYADGTRIEYDREASQLTLECVGDVVIKNARTITIENGDTIQITAGGAVTLTAPSLTVDAPQSTFTGAVLVQGALTYRGGMTGSGGSGAAASIQGTVNVTGGDVTADGISLKTHTHTGDDGGNTSQPR